MDKAQTLTTTTITSTNDQTHDFMNVDSFSQLPFIRPSPSTTKDNKPSSSAAAASSSLRLFGIDFASSLTATDNSDSGDSSQTNNNHQETKDTKNETSNGESGRKFECHYCCRSFPTSQALGGHQNAHKRERQHAKRAHLQSAMIAADPHHLYNLVNYTTAHHHHPHHHRPPPPTSFTSRFSYLPTTNTSPSIFGNHNTTSNTPPTINGSPLMWRIPSTTTTVHPHHHHHHHLRGLHRDRSLHPLPYFGGSSPSSAINVDNTTIIKASVGMNVSMADLMSNNSSQTQVAKRAGDHVSLDLHL